MGKKNKQESGRHDASQGPDQDTNVELAMHVFSTTATTVVHTTQISARQQYGLSRRQRHLEHRPQHQGRQDDHQEGQHHSHIHVQRDESHTHHAQAERQRHNQHRPRPPRHLSEPYNKHAREHHRAAPSSHEKIPAKKGNNTPNQRQWSADVQGDHFTLMTYNLLSKTLCQLHEELYSNCHPRSLKWSTRRAALLREIESLDLDIYCFQELDEDDYTDQFEPKLRKLGYTGFYQRRTGDRNDGCALFYRSQKVQAVLIRGVEFNQNRFIGRDNVGIVAILEVTQGQSKKKVCVATTHILFNPRRGMVKIAQLKMLLESAQLLIEEQDEDIPLVLCGDMNASPNSFVLHYLQSQDVDATMQMEVVMSQKLFDGQAARPSGTYPNGITEFNASFRNIRQALAAVLGTTYRPPPELQLQQEHLHTPSDVLTLMANMHIPPGTPQQQQQHHHHHLHHHLRHQHHQKKHDPSSNRVSQPFQLQSAYEYHTHIPGRQKMYKQWTTYHTASKEMCDFIMYGHLWPTTTTIAPPPSQQTPSRLEVLATLVLPCRELDKCHGLPIRYFGSDHLSLAAVFRFA